MNAKIIISEKSDFAKLLDKVNQTCSKLGFSEIETGNSQNQVKRFIETLENNSKNGQSVRLEKTLKSEFGGRLSIVVATSNELSFLEKILG